MTRRIALWLDVALKAALIGLLLIRNSPELGTAYEDTLGQLALGLTVSVVAALVTAWLWPRLRSSD